ncbi:predicted protein [Naegleria gruberi]|uniref:Peptide deformylase n=1 Tax=Naegleria gruberi TaxID=5762 RepID=D2VWI9_NAEGR|nr:uncharacterized protein NAEGRDRAFT_52822 [Naegleria gruberi]EFC38902.1 predicted protein [Naegleria gruberi]|eukprot:XP_002671646.1 predicted protein [Naegleria gruberi strain NEG-M]
MINAEIESEGNDKILPFRKVRIAGKKEPILKQPCTGSLLANNTNFTPRSILELPGSMRGLKKVDAEENVTSYYDVNRVWTDKSTEVIPKLSDDDANYLYKQLSETLSENQIMFFRDLFMSLKVYHDDGTGISAPQLYHKIRYFIGTDRIFKATPKLKVVNAKQSGGFEEKKNATSEIFDPDASYAYDVDLELYIDPKIVDKSVEMEREVEGCLSFKNEYLFLMRSKEIEVEYINMFGVKQRKTLDGFSARVFQHEFDHLEGINMFDRVVDKKKDRYVYGEDVYNYLDELGNLRPEFK